LLELQLSHLHGEEWQGLQAHQQKDNQHAYMMKNNMFSCKLKKCTFETLIWEGLVEVNISGLA
jgi:hypothetical protein